MAIRTAALAFLFSFAAACEGAIASPAQRTANGSPHDQSEAPSAVAHDGGAVPTSPDGTPPDEPSPVLDGGAPDAASDAGADDGAPDSPARGPTFLGAGDIGSCESVHDEETAALLDAVPGTVFTLGDNVYEDGTADEFARCFADNWGRHKARIRPTVGNHEYHTRGAAPYYDYFGDAAGPRDKGYYSYELGTWHVVALNTNIPMGDSSEQAAWLRADLAQHETPCVLAYMHHPRFSSGDHGDNASVDALWRILHDAGVDVVVAGHDHHYERFPPLDAAGDPAPDGMVQFVVGSGGKNLRRLRNLHPERQSTTDTEHFGVLALTLDEGAYSWRFLATEGENFDAREQTAACR